MSGSLSIAAGLLILSTTLPAADPLYESAKAKLDKIELGEVKPGSVITFSPGEINAWARVRVPEIIGEGIRNPRVEMGVDTATGFALMDFLKMRQAKGIATNWLVTRLIEGERPVKIAIHVNCAGGGRCTVNLTRVEISNAVATGGVLDFLVKNFFMTLYPEAKIDEPFELDYNIDRFDVRPTGVRITMKK